MTLLCLFPCPSEHPHPGYNTVLPDRSSRLPEARLAIAVPAKTFVGHR